MGTPAERKALLFLSLVALLGAGVRLARASRGPELSDADARRALREQMIAVQEARRSSTRKPRAPKKSSRRADSAVGPRPAIDVDMASAAELETLPGIGPALALRIVEERNRNGPFGSITALQRVRGIGPALSNRLTPHVTFSGTPRPASAVLGGRSPSTAAGSRPARGPP